MKIIGIDYSLTSPAITIYNGNDKWNYNFGTCTHFCLANNERQRSKWAEIRSVKTEIYPVWDNDLQRYHGLANWVINCCITAISPERPKAYIEDYAYAATGRVFHIAENMAILKDTLTKWGIKYEMIAPTVIKKYATGKGNANKEKMYDAFTDETNRKLLDEFGIKLNNPITDIVDSYYIAKYGHTHGNNT